MELLQPLNEWVLIEEGSIYEIYYTGLIVYLRTIDHSIKFFHKQSGIYYNRNIKGKRLKIHFGSQGYLNCRIYSLSGINLCGVHHIIGLVYLPNPENKPHINHINGIKIDIWIKNLEWNTAQENSLHAARFGLTISGEKHHYAKMTNNEVINCRNLYNDGLSIQQVADKLNKSYQIVYRVIKNIAFKHL